MSLRTHSGLLALLGSGDLKAKEAKLAAVLMDLEARKKHASQVDMRFENSAVVRLASR
jgi:cell division septal protein FtsQ